jgi:predicted RNase H-like HicB family nuclease
MAVNQELHVNVRNEDNSFWATVDEFPGVLVTGDDLAELRESLEEGIALMLERDGEVPTVRIAPLKLADATASTQLVLA